MNSLRQNCSAVQECADELAELALSCADVFDDCQLLGIFIENLNKEIRLSIRQYWSTHASIEIQALIAFSVSIDTTHAVRKRELSTSKYKKPDPVSYAQATGCPSTIGGHEKTLLASQAKDP